MRIPTQKLDRLVVELIYEKLRNASRSRARKRIIQFSPEELETLCKMVKEGMRFIKLTDKKEPEYASYTY